MDSSVLLDVFGADARFGARSREALRAAYGTGSLVACDVVWAEVRAHFGSAAQFESAMDALGVEFDAVTADSASLAGELWRRHHDRRGGRRHEAAAKIPRRVGSDFLVGAHALRQADALLARDRGFFRPYFRGLKVVEP